ncbi:MAG: hypothetical protein K6F98_05640 [Bacteroidales bacterium]|nr:hypothetical protein [Bacteroidales bacterium]
MKKETKETIGGICSLLGVVSFIVMCILARFTSHEILALGFGLASPILFLGPLAFEEHKGGCIIDRIQHYH